MLSQLLHQKQAARLPRYRADTVAFDEWKNRIVGYIETTIFVDGNFLAAGWCCKFFVCHNYKIPLPFRVLLEARFLLL